MTDSIEKGAVERAIATVKADTSKVAADVRGTTVALNGEVADSAARMLMLSAVLSLSAVEQVIDSLHVGGEMDSTQVYMKKGDQLARMLQTYFGDELTWDEYKAAKRRAKPL
jgi:osmotically-inducible protein OsmY